MAEVFKARLPGVAGFEKTLVIKRMLPHLSGEKRFVEMFVAEARLAAEVQHRNVVQVFELGQNDGGEFFIAMEYVHGTDLRKLLATSVQKALRLPPWFSIYVVCEVLEGLSYAHTLHDREGQQRNIVHRDVTPANVFISRFGEVKLGDFGVAHDSSREWRTEAGQLKGKIAYMAPEQLYARDIDARVDVFAMGVVLWEALTQRRLFGGGPDIEVMNRIVKGKRKPVSKYARDIPPALDDILARTLAVERDERFTSAQALQSELLDVLKELAPQVRPEQVKSVLSAVIGPEQAQTAVPKRRPSSVSASGGTGSHKAFSTSESDISAVNAPLADPYYHRGTPDRAEGSMRPDSAVQKRAVAVGGFADDLVLAASPPPERGSKLPGAHGPSAQSAQFGELQLGEPQLNSPSAREVAPVGGWAAHGAPQQPSPQAPPQLSPRPRTPIDRWATPSVRSRELVPVGAFSLRTPGESSSEDAPERSPSSGSVPELTPLQILEPVEASPPQAQIVPKKVESRGEIDVETLVNNAVEEVRTVVSIEQKSQEVPQESSVLAGLDVRRHASRVSDMASKRWESYGLGAQIYDGPHPFWLRDETQTLIGPCSWDQTYGIVKSELRARLGASSQISGDNETWCTISQFAELVGMESLLRDHSDLKRRKGVLVGSLERRSLTSLFGMMAKNLTTGRLVIVDDTYRREDFLEIEMVEGMPTHVYASDPRVQLPSLLVSKKLVPEGLMEQLVHISLSQQDPLTEVVSRGLGTDLARYRPMFMKERLIEIFSRRAGRFVLEDVERPARPKPFAKSMLQLLPELVHRSMEDQPLKAHLSEVMDCDWEQCESFSYFLQDLRLSRAQLGAAWRLANGKRLGALLRQWPEEARLHLTVAYVLMEAELLRPVTNA